MDFAERPIESLSKTSPVTIKKLKSIDIVTFWDLINYFPFRYQYYKPFVSGIIPPEGESVRIQATVSSFKNSYVRRNLSIQKVQLVHDTSTIEAAFYNQPYLKDLFTKNRVFSLAGTIKKFGSYVSIYPDEYEQVIPGIPLIHTREIVPVYSTTYGISSKTIREKIFQALLSLNRENIHELLPTSIVNENNLSSLFDSYQGIHFPASYESLTDAKIRFSFTELFLMQLASGLIRQEWKRETTREPFKSQYIADVESFIKNLPYTLTEAQKRVSHEIIEDLKKSTPMNRFVQGDVGSGKTVIAAIAAYFSYLNGQKTLIMAPTEILANQHFQTLSALFKDYPLRIGLQTGSRKDARENEFDILIGTHALLNIEMNEVGLVVIDEQHRFGVAQRAKLKAKGVYPHLMTMTATPIPRTVSLTLYGELDLSIVDEMPKGRIPIKTYVVPQTKRESAYEWIKKQVDETKCQVFVICPLIDESEVETLKSIKAANKEYDHLKKVVFPTYSVGLLHGKLKPKEKDEIMTQFKDKKYDILVSTSVVEVGIDIANASIIVIEGAERFGMAQLHQLRGRVGRGSLKSHCLLFTTESDQEQADRLAFFASNTSGIKLAEFDLKKRGPGSIFGFHQHGYSELKMADFSDLAMISKTKKAADLFIEKYSLKDYPLLAKRVSALNITKVSRD